jgi:hypothetical protein
MRSISQFGTSGRGGGGGDSTNVHITGTQSLNRNLASRSTGALMMPNSATMNGAGSTTLSDSNDSTSHFHTTSAYPSNNISQQQQQQQQSSSAHHLAYLGQSASSQPQQQAALKSATLQSQQSVEKQLMAGGVGVGVSSSNYYEPPDHLLHSSQPQLQKQQNFAKQFRGDNDTSTHGSRTIDSRYSRDKTLGLSDEDDEAEEEEEEEDEEEEEVEDDGEVEENMEAREICHENGLIDNQIVDTMQEDGEKFSYLLHYRLLFS